METFGVLLLAHLLGDFPLQSGYVFRLKMSGNRGLAVHVLIHVVVTAVLIERPFSALLLLLILGGSHFLVDWSKIHLQKTSCCETPGFIVDQLLHIGVIILLSNLFPDVASRLHPALLATAVIVATIPAFLTLGWVWANDRLKQDRAIDSPSILWASRCLLDMSHGLGWLIILCVSLTGFI